MTCRAMTRWIPAGAALAVLAALAGCTSDLAANASPGSSSSAPARARLGFSSAVRALAAGKFEGASIPEPTRHAALAEP